MTLSYRLALRTIKRGAEIHLVERRSVLPYFSRGRLTTMAAALALDATL
jgi:hypothetical protein